MADFVVTPALATWGAYLKGLVVPGAVGIMLLKAAEAEATLRTRANLATLLGATGNTEADWTGGTPYARKTGLTPANALGTARLDSDIADPTWVTAGISSAPQNLVRFVVYWRPTSGPTDTNSIILGIADYPEIANGADITATINATGILSATG